MNLVKYFGPVCIALSCNGCARMHLPNVGDLPFVHKIDIQQGNVVTQEMVAQLQPGMDKKKVNFIMGSPIIRDTFHASRWDYLYTYQSGGGRPEKRRITLIFEDEKLARAEGDIKPAEGRLVVDMRQDTTVEVPGEYEPGLMSKIKNTIPFVGDDDEQAADQKVGKEDEAATADAESEAATATTDTESEAATATTDTESEAATATTDTEEVTVPEDAPKKKKKGFFARLFGSDDDDDAEQHRAEDRKYRDITDPDSL